MTTLEMKDLMSVEGRILLHAEDEVSGRSYLMLEGTDALRPDLWSVGAINSVDQFHQSDGRQGDFLIAGRGKHLLQKCRHGLTVAFGAYENAGIED